eukprot:TRINITY_DN11434_c0_g1_i1.p1 TRINITY_DN11434_c0_g1~~TRINITY_DN11434_c0_g1_i1.p1  ORF type:complete len:532 (-),score=117.01 TRINITY_DN11434_c0_g1_i1:113-1678(-)
MKRNTERGEEKGKHKKQRLSRWDTSNIKSNLFPIFVIPRLEPILTEALLLRIRIEEITYKLTTGQLDNLDREPEPEPIYDSSGKRTNTKEMVVKERLKKERQKLIEKAYKINPLFRPPPDYVPIKTKKSKKLYIPISKYPGYNFIGLIIGPRGMTQKEMERETGTKISIRGKGSIKEGKKSDSKQIPGEDDDLHVLITGDSDESIARASVIIEKLLIPIDEKLNEHKSRQLEKLAELNGTLKERKWSLSSSGTGRGISCSFCGDASHPSTDCPMKGKPGARSKMDQEYELFLSEIGAEKKEGQKEAQEASQNLLKSYEEFLALTGAGGAKSVSTPVTTPAASATPLQPQSSQPQVPVPPFGLYPPAALPHAHNAIPTPAGMLTVPGPVNPTLPHAATTVASNEATLNGEKKDGKAGGHGKDAVQQQEYADPAYYQQWGYGYYPGYYDYSQYYWGQGGAGAAGPAGTGGASNSASSAATPSEETKTTPTTEAKEPAETEAGATEPATAEQKSAQEHGGEEGK